MKLSLVPLLCSLTWSALRTAAEESCTHGKIFVSDANSPTVHRFDADAPAGSEGSVTVGSTNGLVLWATASGHVSAQTRGTAENRYLEGRVDFINSGLAAEFHGDHYDVDFVAPSLLPSGFDCARPIHFTPHAGQIAIFCDGFYGTDANTLEDQVNSTVWVVAEDLLTTANAVVEMVTLEGSHHGVAIPVDDNHLLYSLATSDRIARTPGVGVAEPLPDTFQVVDYDGNLLHALDDVNDPARSCAGFHGEWAIDNQFALGCDDDHGGILRVDYNPTTETYTSRALSYPATGFDGHRTGSFAHAVHGIEHGVANFNLRDGPSNLVAFTTETTQMTTSQILPLPASPCAYEHEIAGAEYVLVWMPTGVLHIFEFHDGEWEAVVEQTIVPGMTTCAEALFVGGIEQAFVLVKASQEMHRVDLKLAHCGILEVSTTNLGFEPFDAVLSGYFEEIVCGAGDHDGHSHIRRLDQHEGKDACPTSSPTPGNAGNPSPTQAPTSGGAPLFMSYMSVVALGVAAVVAI